MCYRAWLLRILYILLGLCGLGEQRSSKLQKNSGVDWMDGTTIRLCLWIIWNSEGFQDIDTESGGCGVFFLDQRGCVSVRMIYFKWSFKSPPSQLCCQVCWKILAGIPSSSGQLVAVEVIIVTTISCCILKNYEGRVDIPCLRGVPWAAWGPCQAIIS